MCDLEEKAEKEGVVKDSVSLYTAGCPLFWSTSLYMKAFLPRRWDDQTTRKCSAADFWNNFKITECQNRKVSKLTLKNRSLWVQAVIKPKDNSIVGPDFLSPGYFKVNPKTNTIKSQKAEWQFIICYRKLTSHVIRKNNTKSCGQEQV